jgi:hypothetical protein
MRIAYSTSAPSVISSIQRFWQSGSSTPMAAVRGLRSSGFLYLEKKRVLTVQSHPATIPIRFAHWLFGITEDITEKIAITSKSELLTLQETIRTIFNQFPFLSIYDQKMGIFQYFCKMIFSISSGIIERKLGWISGLPKKFRWKSGLDIENTDGLATLWWMTQVTSQ